VSGVHIAFEQVTAEMKAIVYSELASYEYAYTTNYDLMYYWAISQSDDRFKDYLWHMKFDPANTAVWGNATKVLYLHGALHLYKDSDGVTVKRGRANEAKSILRQIDEDHENFPLFVSEGNWKEKVSAIRRNDYLAFAYQRLMGHDGSMVVFGHSLNSEFDGHILQALVGIEKRRYHIDKRKRLPHQKFQVAISILPSKSNGDIIYEKAQLIRLLPEIDLTFFDATTHPLGDTRLRVLKS
jgi:hypothetical protein